MNDRQTRTCQNQPHENVPQEGVVDDVPKPVEMGEKVMHRVRAGFQEQTHSGPELGCGGRTREKTMFLLLEVRADVSLEDIHSE